MTALFFARESLWRLRRARRHGRVEPDALRALRVEFTILSFSGLLLLGVHRLWGLVPIGAAAALLLVFNLDRAAQREERSMATEIVAILGFAMSAPAAFYAVTGTWHVRALWLWLTCLLYFSSSVFHVKTCVLAVHARRPGDFRRMRLLSLLYHAGLATTLAVFSLRRDLPLLAVAFAPVLLRALWGVAHPPRNLNLKRIGILEIAYSVNFLLFSWLALRSA
jgi:hypothetical protein